MIQSTKGKLAANAVKGKYGKGFPGELARRTRAMHSALDAAVVVKDPRFPSGNHLEELKRDRAEQHSVRINGQWRIPAISQGEIVSQWRIDRSRVSNRLVVSV